MQHLKKLKKLKLIIFDIDGTLIDSKGELGEETKRLIPKLKNVGVSCSFATGRQYSSLLYYAETLAINNYVVSLDGALIKHHVTGHIIYRANIAPSIVKKAIQYSDQLLIKMVVCDDDTIYYTDYNSPVLNLLSQIGANTKEVRSYLDVLDNNLEVVFINETKDPLKYLKSKFGFPYTFGMNSQYTKSLANEGIYLLELKRSGVDKAKGMKRLISHLGIGVNECAVVGDWYNDLPLFKTNALKVSLENSISEIKYLSDIVTSRGNDDDGVAEFLEMVLKVKTDR